MRVLVTGGAGYIGSHTVRLLQQRGCDVWVYDDVKRGHRRAAPADRLVVGELADAPRLEELIRGRGIEAIIHFAALTYVGESVQDPATYYRNNVGGTLSLLEAARRGGVGRIVFSSTAAVYGNPERVPIEETDPLRPINPYGRSKLMVEQILADHAAAYGLGYTALRYFNAAGASPDGDLGEDHTPETHLIPLVLQVALGQRAQIDVFGSDYPTPDGTCVRDYVHVCDLAEAHWLAVQQIEPGRGCAYNLGIGRGYSVREVIQTCREVTGKEIPERAAAARAGDPAELVAASRLALDRLGWRPRFTELRDIVRTAWAWHQGHPRGYGA